MNIDDPNPHIKAFTGGKVYGDNVEIGFCLLGTFGELFELEALQEDYIHFTEAAGITDLVGERFDFIQSLRTVELKDYLIGYEYRSPKSMNELIITGLILGYPVETTFALIWDAFK